MCLRTNIHRIDATPQVRVAFPSTGDLRAEGTRGPCVHHVRVADETTGLSALILGEAVGNVARRVDRQSVVRRDERSVVYRVRVCV